MRRAAILTEHTILTCLLLGSSFALAREGVSEQQDRGPGLPMIESWAAEAEADRGLITTAYENERLHGRPFPYSVKFLEERQGHFKHCLSEARKSQFKNPIAAMRRGNCIAQIESTLAAVSQAITRERADPTLRDKPGRPNDNAGSSTLGPPRGTARPSGGTYGQTTAARRPEATAPIDPDYERRARELREGEKAAFVAMQEANVQLQKRAEELVRQALGGRSPAFRAYIEAEDAAAIAGRVSEQAYVHIQTERKLEEYKNSKLRELDGKIERARSEIEFAKKHGLDTSRSDANLARFTRERTAALRTYDEIVEKNAARIAGVVSGQLDAFVTERTLTARSRRAESAAACRDLLEGTVDADIEGLYWRGGNRRLAEQALKSQVQPGDDSYLATLTSVDTLTDRIERTSEELVAAVAYARREQFSVEAMGALRRKSDELSSLRNARAKALKDIPKGTLAEPPAAARSDVGTSVQLPSEATRVVRRRAPGVPVPGKLRMPLLTGIVEDRLQVLSWKSGDRAALEAKLREFAASAGGRKARGDLTVEQYVKQQLAEADEQIREIDRITSSAETELYRSTPASDPEGYERNLWHLVEGEAGRAAEILRARERLDEIGRGCGWEATAAPLTPTDRDDEAQRALDAALDSGSSPEVIDDAAQRELEGALGRTAQEADEHRRQVIGEQSELAGGLEGVQDSVRKHRTDVAQEQRDLRESGFPQRAAQATPPPRAEGLTEGLKPGTTEALDDLWAVGLVDSLKRETRQRQVVLDRLAKARTGYARNPRDADAKEEVSTALGLLNHFARDEKYGQLLGRMGQVTQINMNRLAKAQREAEKARGEYERQTPNDRLVETYRLRTAVDGLREAEARLYDGERARKEAREVVTQIAEAELRKADAEFVNVIRQQLGEPLLNEQEIEQLRAEQEANAKRAEPDEEFLQEAMRKARQRVAEQTGGRGTTEPPDAAGAEGLSVRPAEPSIAQDELQRIIEQARIAGEQNAHDRASGPDAGQLAKAREQEAELAKLRDLARRETEKLARIRKSEGTEAKSVRAAERRNTDLEKRLGKERERADREASSLRKEQERSSRQGATDDESALVGTWAHSNGNAKWEFHGDGTGRIVEQSTRGARATRTTYVKWSADMNSHTLEYTITRVRMDGSAGYHYDGRTGGKPYRVSFKLSASVLQIRGQTWRRQ